MSNYLVKLLTDQDGEPYDEPKWCLSINKAGSNMTLCTGEFYGHGESSCQYEYAFVNKGGITCNECLSIIKEIKSVRL